MLYTVRLQPTASTPILLAGNVMWRGRGMSTIDCSLGLYQQHTEKTLEK